MHDLRQRDPRANDLSRARSYARWRWFYAASYYLAGLSLVGLLAGGLYLGLPRLQAFFRPSAPPGGFVIAPDSETLGALVLYGSAMLAIPGIMFLGASWRRRDARFGYQPRPVEISFWIKLRGWILTVVIVVMMPLAFLNYVLGYIIVAPEGVKVTRLGQRELYPYKAIEGIEFVSSKQNLARTRYEKTGPLFELVVEGKPVVSVRHTNGLTEREMAPIIKFIAQRSGVPVREHPYAVPR
jgi:hypothetical protein